ADGASLRLTTGMTLEAWVYPTGALTGWRAVIDKNVDGYYLMASSDQGNRPAVGGAWPPGARIMYGPTGLGPNTWTHLAGTFDGATMRLYVNGELVASQAQTAALTATAGTLQIGADSYTGENFAGRIDEVRIYNRALSAAEIQADMNTGAGSAVERWQGAGWTVFARRAAAGGATYSEAGLGAKTSDGYRVRATEAAGNLSGYSNVASTTTPATPAGLVAAYAFNEGSGTTV